MKRMHIHVGVDSLEQSIQFYSTLFGTEPAKVEADYARWMLDDPRLNFAISTRAETTGVNHLGLQVDHDDELEELRGRLKEADMTLFDEGETVCCYARSDKTWVQDPAGVAWEAYRTMGEAKAYSSNESKAEPVKAATARSCC